MLTLRRVEIRDKYSGEVIGEVTQIGRRVARLLEERRGEFEELMVREGGQPRKFARWELERSIATAVNLERRLELLKPRELPAASGRNILYREPWASSACFRRATRLSSCRSTRCSPRSGPETP
jgi:acyl-CoA reductase-like NAD-dependent aldehyde dehydrogenase